MTEETGKYTVIELSEQLGVKRTTVNDWLTKYAVYIEYAVQGKRRIYSASALAVLRKVAELRGKGLSSFEIDAELAKVCAVHPQPETGVSGSDSPDQPNPEEKPVNLRPEVIRPDEKAVTSLAARHDAEELLRQFQAMMDKIDRLEAMTKSLPASAPAPVSIPVPDRSDSRTALLWGLFGFIVILLAAGGWLVRMELLKMKAVSVRQNAEIVRQVQINEGLRQDVFVLDNTRKDFEANVQRLEGEIARERTERDRQATEAAKQLSDAKASLEQQRKSELQLQQERFEKERLEMVRKFEKQVLEAEKKALELEKREAERKASEALKNAKAEKAVEPVKAVKSVKPAEPEGKPAIEERKGSTER